MKESHCISSMSSPVFRMQAQSEGSLVGHSKSTSPGLPLPAVQQGVLPGEGGIALSAKERCQHPQYEAQGEAMKTDFLSSPVVFGQHPFLLSVVPEDPAAECESDLEESGNPFAPYRESHPVAPSSSGERGIHHRPHLLMSHPVKLTPTQSQLGTSGGGGGGVQRRAKLPSFLKEHAKALLAKQQQQEQQQQQQQHIQTTEELQPHSDSGHVPDSYPRSCAYTEGKASIEEEEHKQEEEDNPFAPQSYVRLRSALEDASPARGGLGAGNGSVIPQVVAADRRRPLATSTPRMAESQDTTLQLHLPLELSSIAIDVADSPSLVRGISPVGSCRGPPGVGATQQPSSPGFPASFINRLKEAASGDSILLTSFKPQGTGHVEGRSDAGRFTSYHSYGGSAPHSSMVEESDSRWISNPGTINR